MTEKTKTKQGSLLRLVGQPDYDEELSQWFTPAWLAERIVSEWGDLFHGSDVLEPSAGRGDLIKPLIGKARHVTAHEIDPLWAKELEKISDPPWLRVEVGDFLKYPGLTGLQEHDVALMNPPYENGQDLEFVLRALTFAPAVVAVLRLQSLAGADRYEHLWGKFGLERLAILPKRPAFSGQAGVRSDFCVALITRHLCPDDVSIEWWLP